jgi:hypothetical protein
MDSIKYVHDKHSKRHVKSVLGHTPSKKLIDREEIPKLTPVDLGVFDQRMPPHVKIVN